MISSLHHVIIPIQTNVAQLQLIRKIEPQTLMIVMMCSNGKGRGRIWAIATNIPTPSIKRQIVVVVYYMTR